MKNKLKTLYHCLDIEEFLSTLFPSHWEPIAARIIESGATLTDKSIKWAPGWSKIYLTTKVGKTEEESYIKSIIFRVHDCIHQLWGLPIPTSYSEDEYYLYKRVQMCGEVAVLTLTEFEFCDWLYQELPEFKNLFWSRNALPLMEQNAPFFGFDNRRIAGRLDGILHSKLKPKWLRDNEYAIKFADDYVPMLERDRQAIDSNWNLLKEHNVQNAIPGTRYSERLDGLELTQWFIDDFNHTLTTHNSIDKDLMKFNRERREKLNLPDSWS